MPKLKNSVPTLRHHRPSGRAVVTIAGKDYYLGTYGSKAAERAYDAKIAEWLASGRSASFGLAPEQATVAQLLAGYRKYAERYYGKHENSTYHKMVRAIARVKKLYAATPVAEFGPVQFKAVRQRMIAEKLSRPYINGVMAQILKIFKWGLAEGLVPVDVYQKLRAVESLRKGFTEAQEREQVRPVDAATVNATIPHLPPVVQSMVKLQLLIGCRPSELCSIKAGMVDSQEPIGQHVPRASKDGNGKERAKIYLRPESVGSVLCRQLHGTERGMVRLHPVAVIPTQPTEFHLYRFSIGLGDRYRLRSGRLCVAFDLVFTVG